MRIDGREDNQIRPINITRDYLMHPEGSVLIQMGNTKIICTVTIEQGVPHFLKGSGSGWLTAEYSMLPRATNTRNSREISKMKPNSRAVEIQRLIGRSLRMAVDLKKIEENTIIVDCDVIQADGGTRTASISGAFVALYDALQKFHNSGQIKEFPIKNFISAVSVGINNGKALLDLCYIEDLDACVDMNIVMTDKNEFVEVQGTGENNPFSLDEMNKMMEFAMKGNNDIIKEQKRVLGLE